jgi:hypothetical protein
MRKILPSSPQNSRDILEDLFGLLSNPACYELS